MESMGKGIYLQEGIRRIFLLLWDWCLEAQQAPKAMSWVGFCHNSFHFQGQCTDNGVCGAIRRKAQLSSIPQNEHTHINHLSGPGWLPREQWTKGNLCPPSMMQRIPSPSWANLNCCTSSSPLPTLSLLAVTGTLQTKSASEAISVHSNNTGPNLYIH